MNTENNQKLLERTQVEMRDSLLAQIQNCPKAFFFPGSPFGAAYSPCPVPTSPNVVVESDFGVSCLIGVHTPAGGYLITRSCEAIEMPIAYHINCAAGDFVSIYKRGKELVAKAIRVSHPEVIAALAEAEDGPLKRLSPLGLDLLMRCSNRANHPEFILVPKKKSNRGAVSEFRLHELPSSYFALLQRTPEGDSWTLETPTGSLDMTTFDAELGC